MPDIRKQSDLALLPEPRFIATATARQRASAIGLIVIAAALAGAVLWQGISEGFFIGTIAAGAIGIAVCLVVLVKGRPHDWRVWISLAATPAGLYLVARRRRLVFVPWPDVVDIGLEKRPTPSGATAFARLTLRLPDDGWAKFGNTGSIKGSGAVRRYLLSALVVDGPELAANLRAFREAHARAT